MTPHVTGHYSYCSGTIVQASQAYFPAPVCDFLITREGRKDATKITQTWHMSDETILDFSPLNAFLSRLIDIPARIIPYNFQNNIALTKELKFALKSVKE
jgi:hypothetical protein